MKKMTKGMLMTALICGAVYMGSTPVFANELQEFALDEYVVTAARTETKLVDTPANITVVGAEEIESRHYQNVSEVLKDVPGANVIDDGMGASEKKIVLNGDERVLILVDGRRVNFDMGTMSRSSFDMNQLPDVNLIERIEVLKGAGGALYGSDAVGGVVNIITKKGDRSFGKISVGFGSNDRKDMSAMYSFKEGKTGVTVSAAKEKQDYYKYKDAASDTTKRWPGKSDFTNEKVSLKIEQELTDATNLTIGYDYSKFDGSSPSYIVPNWDEGAQAYLEKETQNMYAKYDWGLDGYNNGYIQIYHNKLEYDNSGYMEEKTKGFDIQQTLTTSDTNKLVVGSSWRESDVYSSYVNFGDSNKPVIFNYDENIDNLAFFVNDSWEFSPTWTLNAGVRYDDHSQAGDETTLSAGLNKKFDEDSHAYINWGQVFKAPTIDDLYYHNEIDGKYGNPDLDPETGDTWVIGYDTKLNEKTRVGINYFYSELEDAIEWDWNDYPCYAKNVDKQKKRGMELSVSHEVNDNIELTASYTYLKVENNEGNGYVRDWNYIPNTYRLGVHYKDGKWNSNVWLRAGSGGATHGWYNGWGTSYSYVDSSYLTVDLAVTYKATENLSFYAKGYNLFNEAYAEQAGAKGGSYMYPAQSRRFIVGAEYKF